MSGPSKKAERSATPRGRGPEQSRHQDQSVHDDGSDEDTGARRMAREAAEAIRARASGVKERVAGLYEDTASRAGEYYDDAQGWARDSYERGAEWAEERYDRGRHYADEARRRSAAGLRRGGSSAQRFAHDNPMLVGVVGLAAGLLIGSLLPRTRREDRTFGQYADEVREQSLRYAREAAQRGRGYVEERFSDGDERFAQHEFEFSRPRRKSDKERAGPAGRFQNH